MPKRSRTPCSPRRVQLVGEESNLSLLPLPSAQLSGCQAAAPPPLVCLLLSPRGDVMLFLTPCQISICAAHAENGIPAVLEEASSILRQSSNPNILFLIVTIFRSSITHYMLLMRPAESSDICLPCP